MYKKLLCLLLLSSSQVFAHPDYSNKLFSYADSTGKTTLVEAHYTDGIIAADPVRLKVTNNNGKEIYTGDWASTIIAVKSSNEKHTVFEYNSATLIPQNVTTFQGGQFKEGEYDIATYVKSVAIYASEMLILSIILAILFIFSEGSVVASVSVFLLLLVVAIVGANIVLLTLSVAVIFFIFRFSIKLIKPTQ